MKLSLLIFLAILIGINCLQQQCTIDPNLNEVIEEPPKLLNSIQNGKKMLIGQLDDPKGNYLYVAQLKGKPYEMGLAFGKLFKEELKDNLKLFYAYYMTQLQKILAKRLPVFLKKAITNQAEKMLKGILSLNVMITKRYTNPRYFQEIKGISTGSNISNKELLGLNIFPELIKAACTIAGVWSNATQENGPLHLRALDWDKDNPMNKYPIVVVYQPQGTNLHTHANFAWIGFVGSLTGMSDKVTIGQKVWIPPKRSVQMTRYGNPWTYVLRDVLYDAKNIQTALSILSTTHRTCAIHLGIGSVQDQSFRIFQYSQNILNNYDDKNYTHYTQAHPKKKGVAYFDKHVQPSSNSCVGFILTNENYYGNWTAEDLWRTVGQTHKTGDTQLAVFDLNNQIAYISYSQVKINRVAYERNPIKIDMGELFKQF